MVRRGMPFQKLGISSPERAALQNCRAFFGGHCFSTQLPYCLDGQKDRLTACVCCHQEPLTGCLPDHWTKLTTAADEQGVTPVTPDCLQKGIELTRFLIHAFTSVIRYLQIKKGASCRSSANWPLIWCLGEQTFNLLSDAGDDRIVEDEGQSR